MHWQGLQDKARQVDQLQQKLREATHTAGLAKQVRQAAAAHDVLLDPGASWHARIVCSLPCSGFACVHFAPASPCTSRVACRPGACMPFKCC